MPQPAKGIAPNTWRWLCVKYFAECADYLQLDNRTQRVRRGILEATFDEPIAPASPKYFRDMPLSKMGLDAIEVLRDRKLAFPEGANNRVKAIRGVFKWAVRKRLASRNPARDVPYLKSKNPDGWRTWTMEEVGQFEARHPIGTKARLALALYLFTGLRKSDIVCIGRQHVRNGTLTLTLFKGRNREPTSLTLPILPVLQRVIDASPLGDLTFLQTAYGRAWTANGFGNWFHDRCVEAGVPGRAHGLRKLGACIAAENGATERQLMAIFGWNTAKMAEKYTKKARQKRLAESAMHLLESQEQNGTESCPTKGASGTSGGKSEAESMSDFWVGAQERDTPTSGDQ